MKKTYNYVVYKLLYFMILFDRILFNVETNSLACGHNFSFSLKAFPSCFDLIWYFIIQNFVVNNENKQ